MDPLQADHGSVWAQVTPLILARQREIADQALALAQDSGSVRDQVRDVRPADRSEGGAGTGSGEAGLGQRAPEGADKPRAAKTGANELSDEAQAAVAELKARDREVRNHEQAHARVGGQYASAPSYTYQLGPDGQRYAVGGEVQIDVAPVADDPEATIGKMEVVKAAALAPAEPSSADRQVASLADALRAQAVADLAQMRNAERRDGVDMRA